ncbi:polysaccharide pyruvyl transferase family protein [Clostridium thermarum]|uniref:polysaccharide pyruvyl transferase family protein n=1 Tax=Clostridium thermarum TaxID=1716543 RepID=UPI0013CFDE82|nr:polysaccharide pyruvyl transferase family protein [Clostridium thermarum]
MRNILLMGYSLNSGNKGVNALTRGTIDAFLDKYVDNIKITMFSFTVKEKRVNEYFYKGKNYLIEEYPAGLKTLVKAFLGKGEYTQKLYRDKIGEADLVLDISEGDSFSDIYGFKRFVLHSILKLYTLQLKKELILMPQTIGPFKNPIVKKVAANIIRRSTKVYTRDKISYNIVTDSLNVSAQNLKCSPDMAFYMEPVAPMKVKDLFDNSEKNLIGVNISALLYNGGYNKSNMFSLKTDYKDLIEYFLSHILTKTDANIILVPHVLDKDIEIEDDFRLCKKIYEKFKDKYRGRVMALDKFYAENELKGIISQCDFFVGSRMHACIAAISTTVPTMPIAYSRKFAGIWEDLGLGRCVADPREESIDEIIAKFDGLYSDRTNINEQLRKKVPQVKNAIRELINSLG